MSFTRTFGIFDQYIFEIYYVSEKTVCWIYLGNPFRHTFFAVTESESELKIHK